MKLDRKQYATVFVALSYFYQFPNEKKKVTLLLRARIWAILKPRCIYSAASAYTCIIYTEPNGLTRVIELEEPFTEQLLSCTSDSWCPTHHSKVSNGIFRAIRQKIKRESLEFRFVGTLRTIVS